MLSQLGRQLQEHVAGSPLTANQGDLGYPGLAQWFSQDELQMYLELERQAVNAAMPQRILRVPAQADSDAVDDVGTD